MARGGLRSRTGLAILFLVLLVVVVSLGSGRNATASPDLLLLNAHVLTMDGARAAAEAIAVQGDRIAWVGSNEQARKRFANAHAIDLHGATVLPGIIDAHGHLLALGESLLKLNLKDVATEQEIVERVKQKIASAAPNEWILGWGWDEGKWASHYPTKKALSEVAPNNPVYLVGLHTYASWANQKALEIAGISKDTPDPENGKIVREEKTGEPTGILLNHAQELIAKHIPPPTLDQVKKSLELAATECVRNGLTAVHEAGAGALELQALRDLKAEGKLPLRVYVMLDGADQVLVKTWLERGPELDPQHYLTVRSFKLFADGALGSRGAALLQPYSDAPANTGVITTPEPAVYELTRSALEKGFQVCTHAIGDRANRMVLDAYERALKAVPEAHDARLRIEHAQVVAPEDIPRFAKLGVIPSMQPTHATSDMKWAETRLGPRRIKGAYAWRSLLRTGVHLPLSSDFPGETLNPFYGMYAAITRQDPEGKAPGGWYPEQRLTFDEALRGYTTEGAYAEFEEKTRGTIEQGKLADFTIISQDLTQLAPKQILSIQVLKTFVGGRLVYDSAHPDRIH